MSASVPLAVVFSYFLVVQDGGYAGTVYII